MPDANTVSWSSGLPSTVSAPTIEDGGWIESYGKEQKNYEYFCIEQGGQYVGGGIFDWDGKCIMPKDNIDVKNFTPKEKTR